MPAPFQNEDAACLPLPLTRAGFNPECILPYGLTTDHIRSAMQDFLDFLGFVNRQLHTRQIPRLESFIMPAGFSSLVGEFVNMRIPQYCSSLARNAYHNGHPDLLPAGLFPGDAIQYASDGIEVKASRHSSGWQGHNPESVWLMVFCLDSNTSADQRKGIAPRSFSFTAVYAAQLEKNDWTFSGRSGNSRRTITASVNRTGLAKMQANWAYTQFPGNPL